MDLCRGTPCLHPPFRGLVAWTQHEDFHRCFQLCWESKTNLTQNITRLQTQAPI